MKTLDVYKQLEKGKEKVAFRISNDCAQFSEYAHISIDVVYVKPECGNFNNSIGFYDNYYDQKHQYKGLMVSSQMDARSGKPYGYELGISTNSSHHSVLALDKVEEMVKALKPITRKLTKIDEQEGYIDNFVEYIIRLGRVLGVKAYYGKYEGNSEYQLSNNIGHLKIYLNSLIRDNQKTLGYSQAA